MFFRSGPNLLLIPMRGGPPKVLCFGYTDDLALDRFLDFFSAGKSSEGFVSKLSHYQRSVVSHFAFRQVEFMSEVLYTLA
jgi:hypothetical protein